MLKRLIAIATLAFLGSHATGASEGPPPETIELPRLISLALQKDFQIRIVEIDKSISEQRVQSSRGYWDPAIRASIETGDFNQAQEGDRSSLSINQNLPSGARISLDASSSRSKNNLGGADDFTASAGLEITQPLLRDFGNASTNFIKIAKRNYEQSEQSFRQQAISTVTTAITLYNRTALRKDSLRVAEQSRELARKLLSDTRKRADLGTVEARGVEVAETRLAQRESNVVLQRRLYLETLNALKSLVSNEAIALIKWKIEIGALPAPEDLSNDVVKDFEYALQNRPDYLRALLDIEKARIDVKTSGNATLPTLDLSARLFRDEFSNSFSGSFKGLSSAETNLFVGVTFNRPLLNRRANANRSINLLFRDRADLVEQQLQQAIAIQLDNAARRIESEAQSRSLARQGREFAERSLEAEERKLKLGQSTTFFVLEAQEDLTEAQVRELEAIANYNIAVARYHQVKGSTLAEQSIQL